MGTDSTYPDQPCNRGLLNQKWPWPFRGLITRWDAVLRLLRLLRFLWEAKAGSDPRCQRSPRGHIPVVSPLQV